jgi:adenylate kinase family enzyme
VGRRILVDGYGGSGKSTFAKALAAQTGLPLIHLDLHYWQPGWTAPSEQAWREAQRRLLEGDAWIADGNYLESLDLRLARADTVILVHTPWWICAGRAFTRGLRRPPGAQMPEGCRDTLRWRLRDEWRIAARAFLDRGAQNEQTRAYVQEHGPHVRLHVLTSKRQANELLAAL